MLVSFVKTTYNLTPPPVKDTFIFTIQGHELYLPPIIREREGGGVRVGASLLMALFDTVWCLFSTHTEYLSPSGYGLQICQDITRNTFLISFKIHREL